MLSAQLEFCQSVQPKCVSGRDPRNPKAAELLRQFRFHAHLGFGDHQIGEPDDEVLRIQSGIGNPDGSQSGNAPSDGSTPLDLMRIAAMADNSRAFERMVFRSLDEALENITAHAYVGADPAACMDGRWWVAGVNRADEPLRFYVYDQGVGVAQRAPDSMPHALEEYAAQGNRLHDAAFRLGLQRDVLEAACRARRLGLDRRGRGKGFREMVGLFEKHEVDGRLDVISRGARYVFYKKGSKILEASAGLRYEAPGTLISWTISRPRRGGSESPQ